MSRIIVDLKAFGLQYIRNPFGAFFSIGFPILLLVTFGAVFSPSDSPEDMEVHFLIQDLDGTNVSAEFIEIMNQTAKNQTGTFMTYMTEPTVDINEDMIKEHELTAALVIPAGFEENVLNNTSINLILYADKSATTYEYTIDTVDKAIENFEMKLTLPDRVVGRKTKEIDIEEFIFINFFLPGIIALSIMLNCLMILSSLSADYWAKGYFKILKTTPLKKWEWILSKLIWYLIIMGISIFLMLAIGIFAFGVSVSITPLGIALILAGILLFSSIGIIIGALAKNSDTAAGIANAIGQPMMFLSGIFWRLENLPDAVQVISKAFPLTYLGAGLRETMIDGNNTAAMQNLAVVVVLAVIFFIIASRLISWKEK
jgi:ABC-2 type transport system permease protein